MFKYTKDRISVLTILDTRRSRQDGKYPVKVQVVSQRKQWYYPTGKTMAPEEWEKLPTTKAHTLLSIRKDIENSYNLIRDMVEELASTGTFSLDALNIRLKGAVSDTVNTMFRAKITQLRNEDRIGSMLVYDNTLKGLERFAGEKIRFDSITIVWLSKYADFLRKEGKVQTSIAIHMRTIRAVMNEARKLGVVKEAQYPFGKERYKIQSGEGRKLALTIEQVGKIARYDDGTNTTAKYRDYWMFIYLCNGINVADFVKLRYRDVVDGEVCFVRQKTERTSDKQKKIHVTVSEPMQQIINRWGNQPHSDNFIFPVLFGREDAMERKRKTQYLTRAINRRMAEIGKQLGIGKISTYTARHSFATVLKRSGANIAYISESLGHQDLKTTENYLASFEREERVKNANIVADY